MILKSKFLSIDGRTSDLIILLNEGKKIKNKIVINLLIDDQFNSESKQIIRDNLNKYISSRNEL